VTTYTVSYTDGVEGEEVFADQSNPNLNVGASTPAFKSADKGTETLANGTVQPKREGYTFTGWSPEVKATVNAADGTNYVITCTAQWEKNELIVDKTAQLVLVENKEQKVTACFVDYTVTLQSKNLPDQYFIELQDVMQRGLSFVKDDKGQLANLTFTLTKEKDGSTHTLNEIAYRSGVKEEGTNNVYGQTVDGRLLKDGEINNTLATMLFQLTDQATGGLYFSSGDTITVKYRASMDADVFKNYATKEELQAGVKDFYNHVYAITWDAARLAK